MCVCVCACVRACVCVWVGVECMPHCMCVHEYEYAGDWELNPHIVPFSEPLVSSHDSPMFTIHSLTSENTYHSQGRDNGCNSTDMHAQPRITSMGDVMTHTVLLTVY